jgi:hypothetical protein
MHSRHFRLAGLVGATLLSSSAWSYDLQSYYPLAQGNSWAYMEVEWSQGSSRKESETNLERLVSQESVSGVTTWKREVYEPNQSPLEYDNLAWSDEGLFMHRKADEDNGALSIQTCTTPLMLLPRQMDIGESRQSAFDCGGGMSGTLTHTLQGVENVSVEAGSFSNCLKLRLYAEGSGWTSDETQWLCPDVGLVKTTWTDMEGGQETGGTTKELRWATVNGVSHGSGESTVGDIRTAYAAAHPIAPLGEAAFEMHDIHVGSQEISARFVLDPDRLFFAYDPTFSQNGRAYPGVSFADAYVRLNGANLSIFDVEVAGAKYSTTWELQTSPEVGFTFKGAAPMPQ